MVTEETKHSAINITVLNPDFAKIPSFEIICPLIEHSDSEAVFVNHDINGINFIRNIPRVEGISDLIPGKYEGGLTLSDGPQVI